MSPVLKAKLEQISGWVIPEHDILEYLLGKLPPTFEYDGHSSVYLYLCPATDGESWFSGYSMANSITPSHPGKPYEYDLNCDTPTGAAAKLCLALFQQNILTKEQI